MTKALHHNLDQNDMIKNILFMLFMGPVSTQLEFFFAQIIIIKKEDTGEPCFSDLQWFAIKCEHLLAWT